MSVFAGVSVYLNYNTDFLQTAEVSSVFDYTTIANLGHSVYPTDPKGDVSTVFSERIIKTESRRLWVYALDMVITVAFLVYIVVYACFLPDEVEKCDDEVVSVSDYAIGVKNIPEKVTKSQLTSLFSKYGQIEEVHIARDYKGTFGTYKGIAELEVKERRLFSILQNYGTDKAVEEELSKIRAKVVTMKQEAKYELVQKELKISCHDDFPAAEAHVIFNRFEDRNKALKEFNHQNIRRRRNCCGGSDNKDDPFQISGQVITVGVPEEPANIRFENIGVSTWKRVQKRFLALMLVLLVLLISFSAVYVMSRVEKLRQETICTSSITLQEMKLLVSPDLGSPVVYCFCKKRSAAEMFDQEILGYCQEYFVQRSISVGVNIGVALVMLIVSSVLREMISALAGMMLFTEISKEVTAISYIIFWSDIINYLSFSIFIRGSFYGFEPSVALTEVLGRISPSLIEKSNVLYKDFNQAWYLDIGSKIIDKFIIEIMVPHCFSMIYLPIFKWLKFRRAGSARVQDDVNKAMKGETFKIATFGSRVLVQVFLAMLLSPGIPIIILCTFAYLIVFYFVAKRNVIKYFRKPPKIDHIFAEMTNRFMPFILLAHCFMAIMMYKATGLFNAGDSFKLTESMNEQLGFLKHMDFSNQIFYYCILALTLLFLVWQYVLMPFLQLFCELNFCARKEKTTRDTQGEQLENVLTKGSEEVKKKQYRGTFSQHRDELALKSIISYDVRKIPDYFDVFMAMDFTEANEDDNITELLRKATVRRERPTGTKMGLGTMLIAGKKNQVQPVVTGRPQLPPLRGGMNQRGGPLRGQNGAPMRGMPMRGGSNGPMNRGALNRGGQPAGMTRGGPMMNSGLGRGMAPLRGGPGQMRGGVAPGLRGGINPGLMRGGLGGRGQPVLRRG